MGGIGVSSRKSVIETAERLLYLRRCALNDIKGYEKQLETMGKEFDLNIDYENDKVKYRDKNVI